MFNLTAINSLINGARSGDLGSIGSLFDAIINRKALVQHTTQELTVSGPVRPGVSVVELNHATVAVAATIADAKNHGGLFLITDTSASGTAAHSVTLSSGTFDGTNTVATFNAPAEALVVFFDKLGNGKIVSNTGGVVLS